MSFKEDDEVMIDPEMTWLDGCGVPLIITGFSSCGTNAHVRTKDGSEVFDLGKPYLFDGCEVYVGYLVKIEDVNLQISAEAVLNTFFTKRGKVKRHFTLTYCGHPVVSVDYEAEVLGVYDDEGIMLYPLSKLRPKQFKVFRETNLSFINDSVRWRVK